MNKKTLAAIGRFLFPPKHDFDLENPIIDEITTTHEYKLSKTKSEKNGLLRGLNVKNVERYFGLKSGKLKNCQEV